MDYKGGLLHRAVQKKIHSFLPTSEVLVEHRLGNHIADLLWASQKIVFEIQCSPIGIDTAILRTEDYKKEGFFIVWILHQKTFNKRFLSLSELFLRKHPTCYYTNISLSGNGEIYDQQERFKNNERIFRSEALPIDLTLPYIKKGRLFFTGDRTYALEARGFFSSFANRLKYLFNP